MGRVLKIFCGVLAIVFLLAAATILALYFTILKPKQPIISSEPVMLKDIDISFLGFNVTLAINIMIYNRNYGSFRYNESTTYISYRGTEVAEGPIDKDNIPARGRHNISTSVTVFADKLVLVPGFLPDLLGGVINFTSSTTLHGHVKVLKLLKAKATTENTCDISISLANKTSDSVCTAKVKF